MIEKERKPMKNNDLALWSASLPCKEGGGHKYQYGHALIYAAPKLTGATRLAAVACARMGAGLTTVLSTQETEEIYKSSLPPHLMTRADLGWWDERITARLYGSGGLAVNPDYGRDIPTLLDADAINHLPDSLSKNYVLTPHEGEFTRAFPDILGSKVEKAQRAAAQINANIVLKGETTIIASPNGDIVENTHSSACLATAGTGDVLAGMIVGLMAQGMPPFEASCAAVWIHGEASIRIGAGLVASDIEAEIPAILKAIQTAI